MGFSFWAASPVRRLSEIAHVMNSQPGLSHIVLAGANKDGMKEVISCFSFCLFSGEEPVTWECPH